MKRFLTTILLTLPGLSSFAAGNNSSLVQQLRAENARNTMLVYGLSVMVVVIASAFAWFVISVHLKALRADKEIIQDQKEGLDLLTKKIAGHTQFKEEYIGKLLTLIAVYILKIEKIKRSVERKILTKKYGDILMSFNEINIKTEREELFNTFDTTFLKIYPDFVSEFNAMLKKEDQLWPAKNGSLTTDLRIFALMRLGIYDCETIASILEYSANTIYVYKMRTKAKAIVPAEQFDHAVMPVKPAAKDEKPFYRKSA